jgi:hypothetical protein
VTVDVIAERWLTDEEMKDAKDRQMLAWQSPTKRQSPTLIAPRPTRLSVRPLYASMSHYAQALLV